MLILRFEAALALGAVLLSGGCVGRAPPPVPLSALPAGTTTLRVTNHVSAPGQLDGVTIAVDGQVVPLSSVPPYGAEAATVASLGLRPGPHAITVRARAHTSAEDVIVVGAHQPFHVAAGPAAITIDVRSGTPGSPAAAPVAVTLAMLGGHMAPFAAPPVAMGNPVGVPHTPPDDKDQHCAGLLPIPHAACRAAIDLDDAARKNDVVTALCVRDKLAEIRKLAVIGESGKAESIALAEAQAGIIAHQVDLCGGAPVAIAPDGVTVTRLSERGR